MPKRGKSKLKSATTRSNSDCVCATTAKASIQPILAAKGSEGHYGLPGIRERAQIMGG